MGERDVEGVLKGVEQQIEMEGNNPPGQENLGHKIGWDKVVLLDYEKKCKRMKIKKAVYINADFLLG